MEKEELLKTEMRELDKLKMFIDRWTGNNPYNPSELAQHNEKFRKDMNTFFNKANFKTLKVGDFL